MLRYKVGRRIGAMLLLWGAWFFSFQSSAYACEKSYRAKGSAACLQRSAEKLAKRIECLEYTGPCTQVAWQLERATCALKQAVNADAPWFQVECALQETKSANVQLVSCVARTCVLRDDSRIDAELQRLQDYLCNIQDQLRVSLEKLGRVPPNLQVGRQLPNGRPPLVESPWMRSIESPLGPDFENEWGGNRYAPRGGYGMEDRFPQMQQIPNGLQQLPNGLRQMQIRSYPHAPQPQIRVQGEELGRDLLRLVLARALQ